MIIGYVGPEGSVNEGNKRNRAGREKEREERKKESASDRWTDGQINRYIVVDREVDRQKERETDGKRGR